MTCIDRLKELHPDWDEERINQYTIDRCPHDQYIAKEASFCSKTMNCELCWNRDVSHIDEDALWWKADLFLKTEDARRLDKLVDNIGKSEGDIIGLALEFYEKHLYKLGSLN